MNQINGNIFLLMFCHIFGSLMVPADSAEVEQVLIPENSTTLNVEVCPGKYVASLTIIDEDLTWFEGMALCEDMGLGSIDIAVPSWARRNQVRKYLEDTDYRGLKYSFWTGAFRSFNLNNMWYYGFEKCKDFNDAIELDYLRDGLCVAIGRNESAKYMENIFVDDCNSRRPFFCSRSPGNASFLAYNGFDIPAMNITDDIRPSTLSNVTMEFCEENCFNTSGCTAFTYYHDTENCTTFQMTFATDKKSYLNYQIIESTRNLTHYAKTGCHLNFTSFNISVPANVNTTMPVCKENENDTDCICKETESHLTEYEIETIVNELVTNLTVDPKATAARRRKLTSAEDSRPASTAVGSVGIISMAIMISLPVIADCFLPGIKVKKTPKT